MAHMAPPIQQVHDHHVNYLSIKLSEVTKASLQTGIPGISCLSDLPISDDAYRWIPYHQRNQASVLGTMI